MKVFQIFYDRLIVNLIKKMCIDFVLKNMYGKGWFIRVRYGGCPQSRVFAIGFEMFPSS